MWHPDAYQALIAEDYPQVAAIYEELIDNNPENVSDYWYFGRINQHSRIYRKMSKVI